MSQEKDEQKRSSGTRRAFLAAGLGVGLGGGGAAAYYTWVDNRPPVAAAVRAEGIEFIPAEVTIERGDRVGWVAPERGHTVTAYEDEIPDEAEYFASGGWDSEAVARTDMDLEATRRSNIRDGEWYVHQFWIPGNYEYFCIPHERQGMVGTIEVLDPDDS